MNFLIQNINIILGVWAALAVVVFVALFFIPAPYGRHAKKGWGPMIPARVAWIAMEGLSPATLIIAFLWARHLSVVATTLMCLWVGHYLYRTLVFPFLLRPGSHPVPLSVILMSVFFNAINAGTNGIYLFFAGPGYTSAWLRDPRFFIGITLFFSGFLTHVLSDRSLTRLREPGESGYKIPKGGLFEYVSCPNYFGEVIEWTGWAIAAWNPAGFAFALWTIANLVPRAITHHKWYLSTFSEYPRKRKAVLPFVL